MNDLQSFLNLDPSVRRQFFSELGFYNYAIVELDGDNHRNPIYIGKGKGDRCLQHLDDKGASEKSTLMTDLYSKGKLGIDILAYQLDEKTAFAIESVCIDLLNIENLTNSVRGHGENTKRLSLNELANLIRNEPVDILPEHKGVAFLLEKTFRHSFGDIELFEHTRGIWSRAQKDDVKFAYATFRGIIKEVYEIHSWVPAGTQEYFCRKLDPEKITKRYEFVGKKAPQEIRSLYVGKLINKKRSYGDPFVKVGFDN